MRYALAAVVVSLAAPAIAQSPATAPSTAPATRPAYVGSFEYVYPGPGFRVRADVPDATHLKWTILAGARNGESEDELVDRRTIAPGIEFVSWTEQSGATVVQIADFNVMRLTTCLIIGGKRTVLEGRIERID